MIKRNKSTRQKLIKDIIKKQPVRTQDSLLELLKDAGVNATQATLSRDIKELNIVKISDQQGGTKYACSTNLDGDASSYRFKNVLMEAVRSITPAENIVVIKSYPGMGSAVGASIDMLHDEQIVGSLAGDDTVFIVLKNKEEAKIFADHLKEIIEQ
jgi:transcriptional regulator of arginine metabolism